MPERIASDARGWMKIVPKVVGKMRAVPHPNLSHQREKELNQRVYG
jgi:hypothetical protein